MRTTQRPDPDVSLCGWPRGLRPAGLGAGGLRGRRASLPEPTQLARSSSGHDEGVFDAMERRLSAPSDGRRLEPAWASRLRSALARYQRAQSSAAKDPGAVHKWHDMAAALAVVDRMSARDRVPPAALAELDRDGLWRAFGGARQLCRMEMKDRRPHPQLPPPPAVQSLTHKLAGLPRRRRPDGVEAWLTRLRANLGIYIVSEVDLSRQRIPASMVTAAIDDVLDCLSPPSAKSLGTSAGSKKFLDTWEVECSKPIFQAPFIACRDCLVLRQLELAAPDAPPARS